MDVRETAPLFGKSLLAIIVAVAALAVVATSAAQALPGDARLGCLTGSTQVGPSPGTGACQLTDAAGSSGSDSGLQWLADPIVSADGRNVYAAARSSVVTFNRNAATGDVLDNCPGNANPALSDADGDGTGDVCDPTPNPPDTVAPKLRLSGKKKQSNRKHVVVKARCKEDCRVNLRPNGNAKVTTQLRGRRTRTSKVKLQLKAAKANLTAGKTKKLKLQFKGKKSKRLVKKAINQKRGEIELTLRGTATDTAGNKGNRNFKVTIS